MSSLAQQLQGIASLDAGRLTSKTGAPSSKSYLFSAADAAQQDLDAIWAVGAEGFEQLCQLDPDMVEFEEELFAERTKRVDRMMLNREDNSQLDKILERCLRRLGRWIGVLAGGKCIEWLVRRFRVHEMNVETVIQVFLPYHESQNFPRMLAILSIPPTSIYYAPFHPLIRPAQPVPRSYIVTAISPAKEPSLRLLRDVVGSVHLALQEGVVHRALLAFWSAAIIELLESVRNGKGVKEGVVVALVEAFVEILSTPGAGQDVNAAVYPPLILLTRTIRLADEPFLAILSALITPGTGAIGTQRVLTLLVLLNDRKGWAKGLGNKAAEHLAQVKILGDTLLAAMGKYGFEDAVGTVVGVMLDRPDLNIKSLRAILDSPSLPAPIVKIAATKLVQPAETQSQVARTLLSALRERHPAIVDAVIVDTGAQVHLDAALAGKIATGQTFADVYSADIATRVSSIKRILGTYNGDDAAEKASAKEAVKARLADEDLPVVEAIYEQAERVQEMLSVKEVIQAVRSAFVTATPVKDVFLAHLRYLAARASGEEDMLFKRLIFPCILNTDKRTALGADAWSVLAKGNLEGGSVIAKVAEAVVQLDAAKKSDLLEFNKTVIVATAGAISKLGDSTTMIDFLLQQITSASPTSRLPARLILAELLRKKKQPTLALSVFTAIEPSLGALPLTEVASSDIADLASALAPIVRQPNTLEASATATAYILEALTKVARPTETIEWLVDDRQSATYRQFASNIYGLANSTLVATSLATSLLRSLLTQLGKDALLFFASVWTAPSTSSSANLRVAALKHAAAFIRAHASAEKVDFQVILPALLLAIRDADKDVRTAAIELLRVIGGIKESGDVYALDIVYGDRSGQVQLMKPAYLERYISSLLAAANDLILDPSRLISVHASTLGHAGGHNKKDTGVKRAMIASLVSQIVAWQSMDARMRLLETLANVHDATVLKGLIPIWAGLVMDESDESQWLASHDDRQQDAFLARLGKTLDKGSGTALVNMEGESWRYFLGLLSSAPASHFGSRVRLLAQERIASGVFDILPPVQQIPYVSALLQSLHDVSSEEALSSVAILKKLVLSPDVLIQLFTDLAQPLEAAGIAAKKRQRQDEVVDVDKADLAVLDLTVLVESREWSKVPGHAGLVAALLSLLSSILSRKQVVKEGADYLEQEILGAILALLERIRDPLDVQKFHIGIEPIIKTIRTTSNPRTSQRALLVAAELARLIPDAVLHNVMPIFTFMGSTDLQRDDAYTFGVVEKTVKSIVPVLISSLRESAASTGLDLWNAASAFISIFTEMAGRLPKHRTLPFFVHLVESLGSQEFLAPVSWLLIDRATAKASKSSAASGLAQAIDLALGVAGSTGRHARLITLRETVLEAGRLMADLPNAEKSAFLSQFLKETDDSSRTLRQTTALFNYSTGVATTLIGKPADQDMVKAVVENLVSLLALTRTPGMDGTGVQVALQRTLSEAMKLLSADNFLAVVANVLASADVSNAVIALDLFTERLPLVKREIRTKAANAVSGIVRKAADLFASPAAVAALAAVRAVTVSALSGEDSALAVVAPKLVANAKGQPDQRILAEELSLLNLLTRHLGPRVIPAIQPALAMLLGLIDSSSTAIGIVKASFSSLTALVETVPTFISASQLSSVLLASVKARTRAEESPTAMISVCTRKIGTKTLFPVVMDLWKEVQKLDESSMEAYFHLLRLTLKNADRAVLPTLLKTIFNFFLDVFDLRHRLHSAGSFDLDVINKVEESAIGSFLELVTKLSESAFKPLFTRLYDWAVIDLADGKGKGAEKRLNERKTVLLHVMMGLLTKFKSLLSPYIGTLLPHIEELLPAYATGETSDPELWNLLMRVLGKSFEADDGAFWTEALYLKLIPSLTAQIEVFPDRTRTSISEALPYALGAMAASTTSEASLKALNTRICMATRAEEVNVRLAALRVMEAVWDRQAEEMVGLVPETVSEYLAELLEDENADVEDMARGVLARIEKVTGSLKEYLE